MQLLAEPLNRRYSNGLCSAAGFVWLCVSLACLVFPFLMAFFSDGFWLKYSVWQEQPRVKFTREFILHLDGTDNEGFVTTHSWSSNPVHQKFLDADRIRVPVAKFSELDDDLDGRNDRLKFSLSVPLNALESVSVVRLALMLNYELQDVITLKMQSLALLELSTPIPASGCLLSGDLRLWQRELLPGWNSRTLYDYPVVNWTLAESDPMQTRWSTIVSNYMNRDERTFIQADYPVWNYTRAPDQAFLLEGVIRYSPDLFEYIPSGAQLFKWAWIQYSSFLIPVYVILVSVMGLLFRNQLVYTRLEVDKSTAGYSPVKF